MDEAVEAGLHAVPAFELRTYAVRSRLYRPRTWSAESHCAPNSRTAVVGINADVPTVVVRLDVQSGVTLVDLVTEAVDFTCGHRWS